MLSGMSPALARAARALLGMSQSELARAAGLGLSTIVDFEKERRQVSREVVCAIRSALEESGIEFICEDEGSEGLKRRK
ncbi:helix-turn-helix transcriptional regulator [Methylobacterium oxalidis]|uniref:helix-turn-helix transcriptional regulator n=1 Tax=Methylobacterium oxalidis TaxID=944322 RepID=UPI0033149131